MGPGRHRDSKGRSSAHYIVRDRGKPSRKGQLQPETVKATSITALQLKCSFTLRKLHFRVQKLQIFTSDSLLYSGLLLSPNPKPS